MAYQEKARISLKLGQIIEDRYGGPPRAHQGTGEIQLSAASHAGRERDSRHLEKA